MSNSNNPQEWEEHETYKIYLGKQLSPGWDKERWRLTTSLFGAVANPNFYKGHEDVVQRYSEGSSTKRQQSFSEKIYCEYGIKKEPIARAWYCRTYNQEVREVGFIIPNWDNRIGSSPDGLVGNTGMIEIKCPTKMYHHIHRYRNLRSRGWVPPRYYHGHIWDSHYDQMQGGMAIANREWCDYIVYCPIENDTFVERVYRNYDYWDRHLYPSLKKFLEEHESLFKP